MPRVTTAVFLRRTTDQRRVVSHCRARCWARCGGKQLLSWLSGLRYGRGMGLLRFADAVPLPGSGSGFALPLPAHLP